MTVRRFEGIASVLLMVGDGPDRAKADRGVGTRAF